MRVAGPGADSFMYIRYAGSGKHDGETITTISGEGQSSCHRRHLVEEFARVLPHGTIKYGLHASKVVNGTDRATIAFTNGTAVEADFVIGCDGIHGKTRKAVLGENNAEVIPTYSGVYVYRKLIPMEDFEKCVGPDVAHASNMFCGPSSWILAYPVDDGKSISFGAAKWSNRPWNLDHWTSPVVESHVEEDYPPEQWGKMVQSFYPVSIVPPFFFRNVCLPSYST